MQSAPFTTEEIEREVAAMLAEGGPFATQKMTLGGVEHEHVFAASQASLRDLMALRGLQFADNEFIVYQGERLTMGETWAKAMRFANWLVEDQGVTPGDRVAIAMRNYPEWPIAFIGIIAAGAVAVPMNAWWQAEELRDGLERAEVRIVVVDGKRAAALAPHKQDLSLTLVVARDDAPEADADLSAIIADQGLSSTAPAVPIDPDSDFCLLYTSGSTGKPKGVLLTHRGVVNALLSWSFLLQMAQRLRPDVPFTPDNAGVLLCLPLFHVTALHSTLILSWMMGRKTVMMYRWDPSVAIDHIKNEKITNFVGVPTMADELVQTAHAGDLAALVDVTTGGAKRPASQVETQWEKFPSVVASSGYGLTETNSLIVHITLTDYRENPDAAGRIVPPINEIACFTEEGVRLADGEEGEICVKSPVNFRGYLDDEEATKAAFHKGGWFRTGDIGVVSEKGMVTILDRSKDIIIRGGENVACLEVENAMVAFSDIDEVAVFSVPDEKFGERVGAVVYTRGDAEIDLEALRTHLLSQLAGFKVPERIWIAPQALPRGGTGKIDKRQTRQIALMHPAHLSVD